MELIKKLSDLTTIDEEAFIKLNKYMQMIHSQDILTQLLEDKTVVEVEIPEGKLMIQLVDDNVKYKFIPSDAFNKMVIDTVLNKKSELIGHVTDRLRNQLINTHKDLI